MRFNTIGLFTENQPEMVASYRDIWGFKTDWNGAPDVDMTYGDIRLIMYPLQPQCPGDNVRAI